MRPTHLSGVLFTGAMSCLILLAACGKQVEGERCDLNSGNLDCDTGLVCRSGDQASISGRGVALCCPPEGVTPSVNACRAAGAELPPDDQPPAQTSADAGDGGA